MNQAVVKFVTTRKQCLKFSFSPIFKRKKQFHNGANSYQIEKRRINLNKPIYIGTNVLDLSKVSMHGFHYNYIKNK